MYSEILIVYLVFGPVGIGISVFRASSDDEGLASVSTSVELSRLSFSVCEIDSSTDVILAC